MNLSDSLSLAWRTIRGNILRTSITVAIIAFGIMALIGIVTAIDAMNGGLRSTFSTMGASGFTISYKERIRFGDDEQVEKIKRGKKLKKSNLDKPIQIWEAEGFKEKFQHAGTKVSIALSGAGGNEIHYKQKKTNPNVVLRGGDENYLAVNGFTIAYGRNLSITDIITGRSVCLLGNDVATKLFGTKTSNAVDRIVRVGGIPYRVVGVLKAKGSSSLLRADNLIFSSYNNIRRIGNAAPSFSLGIMTDEIQQLDGAVSEATALFRAIRKLNPIEDENFVIEKSDKLASTFIGLLGSIQLASGGIGIITLLGAAIGLMNIMLVAVNERTREIGLIKALGGKKKNIRDQFLFESTIISLLGALFGIILGVGLGNIFALFLNSGFIIPWGWITFGIVICTIVGLLAGLWPAIKASKLNPIIALRYE